MVEPPTWWPTLVGEQREHLRARVFLRAVLPLLAVMLEEHPPTARRLGTLTATVRVEVRESDVGATLRFREGRLTVSTEGLDPDEPVQVRWRFPTVRALNRFFAGEAVRPSIVGWLHPVVLWKTARLLMELKILQPEPLPKGEAERRLRVRLVLTLLVHSLAELYRGGHPRMVALVRASPERVFQWVVTEDGTGAHLRMHHGKIKAGAGLYRGRQPFVTYRFRDVDAVLSVLGETESQMDGLREGLFRTEGCPEYTRKIAILMQQVDALLMTG